jgi:hypothetical protein
VLTDKNTETLIRDGMRVSDANGGIMGTLAFVAHPKGGNFYLNIVKRLLLPNPGIGKLGDDIDGWLATPVTYDGQKKLVPRGQCLVKKYEKIRADLMRTMRNLLTLAQLPDLQTCSPDNLLLGAGYKKDHLDLVRIRHIAVQLDQLKRGPCSGVFYPAPDSDNPAPSLRPLEECQRKLLEMHEAFSAYDGLVAALLGKTPMNTFAKQGENMALVAQVSSL